MGGLIDRFLKIRKIQTAAETLLEAISKNREARELVKIAEKRNKAFCYTMSDCGDSIAGFADKFIKSVTHEIAVGKAIRVSKLARAARCLLKEKYAD